MTIGYPYTYGDSLSSEEARANLTISRGCSIAFAVGFGYYILVPSPAHAVDENAAMAANEARKQALKRITNAVGCSAIVATCGSGRTEAVNQAAKINPRIASAFICGAAVAWCTKYVIFDR